MVTVFGSCRCNIAASNQLNNFINYTHCTKEVLQQIAYIRGEFIPEYPLNIYLFRTAINQNSPLTYNSLFLELFNDSDTAIVEISSMKKYIYKGRYLHHLAVDKREQYWPNTPHQILNGYKLVKQDKGEIEKDMADIIKKLNPRRTLFVTHYNHPQFPQYTYKKRQHLINIVTDTCAEHNYELLNPGKILDNYPVWQIMQTDLEHYTEYGSELWKNALTKHIYGVVGN